METLSPQDHTSSEDPRRAAVSVGPGPEREPDLPKLLRRLERQLDKCRDNIRNNKHVGVTAAEITEVRSSLETRVLPKLRSLESILQPIHRLPKDVFILIPRFFTRRKREPEPGWESYSQFPTNGPLITMTHVCRSWRDVLLSTPSLWTQIDFSTPKSKQAKGFLRRSGKQPLDIYQVLDSRGDVEPFLSTALHNIHRLQRLEIVSFLPNLEPVLARSAKPASELKHLVISNHLDSTGRDMEFRGVIFEGRLPKLISLSLCWLRTDLRAFSFPSLTRFNFTTGTNISVHDLISFFERSPLLEYIDIFICDEPRASTPPRTKRVLLAALKGLDFEDSTYTYNILDYLILPKCAEVVLAGLFTGAEFDDHGHPATRIHPSSIDHLPVTRGITKVVAMPNSFILSGPGGNLRCSKGDREDFDAGFFTSFSPISVSEIRELLVGWIKSYHNNLRLWKQTAAGIRGAFGVLAKVEDLTIVNCETEPFFSTLGATADDGVLLPGLRKLTIYTGCGDLDVLVLIQCAKARKEHSRPIGEVLVVFENEPGADLVEGVESLRAFVGELIYRVGEAPEMSYRADVM